MTAVPTSCGRWGGQFRGRGRNRRRLEVKHRRLMVRSG